MIDNLTENEREVSVPSRGLRYLNGIPIKIVISGKQVSVPSRGLRYLNDVMM